MKQFDIAVIGGGPAGISAAIYAQYDGNSCVLFEERTLAWIPESHINILPRIEGFPGLTNQISGTELVTMYRQSLDFMNVIPRENSPVQKIENDRNVFIIHADRQIYRARGIILCTGTLPLTLNLPHEDQFAKHNIHYFAYGLANKYKGRRVVVAGGRNSGATTAKYLARNGAHVTVVEIQEALPAKPKHTNQFKKLGIEVLTSTKITKLMGDSTGLRSVLIETKDTAKMLHVDGLFVNIGITPNNALAASLGVAIDEYGYIKVNNKQETNIPGVYAAGDLCGNLKHVIAASGQGATAAYAANKYLSKQE